MPELSEYDAIAVALFACCRHSWMYTSFGLGGAAKTGVSLQDVRAAAESSGVAWTDWLVEKINTIVDVVVAHEWKRLSAEAEAKDNRRR